MTRARSSRVYNGIDLQLMVAPEAGVRPGFKRAPQMSGRAYARAARVQRRRHKRTAGQSGNGGEGPEATDEVEAVILRFSLAACNQGCLHLVLESMSPKAPYLLKNRTAQPFQYR
ncbi:TPA: hypothetical protein ACH3X2_006827 [Trebouxia sp. C0005]